MLQSILKLEEKLADLEALLLVFFVLLMLGLATYNVFYRNVLVPIQVASLTEDAPSTTEQATAPAAPSGDDGASDEAAGDPSGFGGGFGDEGADDSAGFGGGFGDAPAPEGEAEDAAGFGGGFGDEPTEEEAKEPATGEATDEAPDPADGFGGGFDAPEGADDGADGFGGGFDAPAGDGAEGFGGGFEGGDTEGPDGEGSAPPVTATDTAAYAQPEPPFIARLIDDLKIEWIDVVLRQLVLVVGFLGAMLATRRRKHITIDALSKVLSQRALYWSQVVTSFVALVVCLVLVSAGTDLVKISIEYPKELVSFADEWHFQLVFPIGFALLSLHFAIRIFESLMWALGRAEPAEGQLEGGPA